MRRIKAVCVAGFGNEEFVEGQDQFETGGGMRKTVSKIVCWLSIGTGNRPRKGSAKMETEKGFQVFNNREVMISFFK